MHAGWGGGQTSSWPLSHPQQPNVEAQHHRLRPLQPLHSQEGNAAEIVVLHKKSWFKWKKNTTFCMNTLDVHVYVRKQCQCAVLGKTKTFTFVSISVYRRTRRPNQVGLWTTTAEMIQENGGKECFFHGPETGASAKAPKNENWLILITVSPFPFFFIS